MEGRIGVLGHHPAHARDALRVAPLAPVGHDALVGELHPAVLRRVQPRPARRDGLLADLERVLDALLGAFPGGSITGAPKKRAMEIIDELEPAPRGAYCGSFFWMDNRGNLDSNILIRTLQTEGDRLYCHGGGGIVFDSVPEAEYEESRFKVAKLMGALEERFLSL